MIKTKEFVHYTGSDSQEKCTLDEQINDFIKDKRLIDIKYQVNATYSWAFHRALVIYADNKDGDK